MSQMINRGKELIRISPKDAGTLEYSTNGGRTWNTRCKTASPHTVGSMFSSSSKGDFKDLTDNGKEILATCAGGLFYSTNEGKTWNKRN